jgi:hypothetical protein
MPISIDNLIKNFVNITSPDEIVQSTWGYEYDTFDGPTNPDMSVRPEWVGKRAGDCPMWTVWRGFKKPIPNCDI